MAAQAQYYAQHPSQLQYMYYPPAMAGAYGQHLASQPVYSSQGYAQQQQAYAMEAARQVQAQQHQQHQQLGGQQTSSSASVSAHPNSPNSHAAALAAVAAAAAGQMPVGQGQGQQASVTVPGGGAPYYMPYSYGGGAQPGAQAPMYHYVSGVAGYPSVYPQPLYRPPYPTSALAASHSQPLSMADALQNVPDEAGPSSANHAASDAGGSEYSSILGAAEHELEADEEQTVKPTPAPARTATSSRKGKRKATAAAEKRSSNEDRQEEVEIPAPPPEKILKMPVEAKVSKKRPKRKRPPGSQAGKEKKHGCSFCGRSFARAYNLKVRHSLPAELDRCVQTAADRELLFRPTSPDARGDALDGPSKAVHLRARFVQPQVVLALARPHPAPRLCPQRGSGRGQAPAEEDPATQKEGFWPLRS